MRQIYEFVDLITSIFNAPNNKLFITVFKVKLNLELCELLFYLSHILKIDII